MNNNKAIIKKKERQQRRKKENINKLKALQQTVDQTRDQRLSSQQEKMKRKPFMIHGNTSDQVRNSADRQPVQERTSISDMEKKKTRRREKKTMEETKQGKRPGRNDSSPFAGTWNLRLHQRDTEICAP